MFAVLLAYGSLHIRTSAASSLKVGLEDSVPLDAWEASGCSAGDDQSEDCQVHLLQRWALWRTGNESAVDDSVGAEAAEQHQSQNVSAEGSWGSGRCNANDEALMHKMGPGHADGSWSQVVAWCARRAYRWFKFHTDEMTKCIAQQSGVRESCAYCFGVVGGQYGYDNCKAPCLLGKWCSHGCLTCTHKAEDTQRCAGMSVDIPQPTFC